MPPPTRAATEAERKTETRNDLIEAFKDPMVLELIVKALAPAIAKAVDEALERRFVVLDKSVSELQRETQDLKQQNLQLVERLSSLESYTRLDQLIISGIPETSFAERTASSQTATASAQESSLAAIEAVVSLCNDKLGIPVDIGDISNAHRLKGGPRDIHRPIIVRFVHRQIRNSVYAARKVLRAAKSNIFISEHLTKEASNLFFEARKLVKEDALFASWTQGGQVFARLTSDPASKPIHVKDKVALQKLGH